VVKLTMDYFDNSYSEIYVKKPDNMADVDEIKGCSIHHVFFFFEYPSSSSRKSNIT